jgi:calcineurin-like phosphoesterase family protein
MSNIFFISDTHFSHENAWRTFKLEDGVTPLRPFTSTEEMDETMIERWNSVVRDKDTIYHLGDVAISRKALPLVKRLKGRKILIKGNHDIFKLYEYVDQCDFADVRAYWKVDTFLLAHIPVHPDSLGRWGYQVHGHLHANRVLKEGEIDPRYFNVSVEQLNYTPISLEELRKKILS